MIPPAPSNPFDDKACPRIDAMLRDLDRDRDTQDVVAALVALAAHVPLPVARVGRSASGAAGVLGALVWLWHWFRLPRVERFRVCARCGLTLDADRARKVVGYLERSGSQYCTGWMGEPYNRCMSATYRLG